MNKKSGKAGSIVAPVAPVDPHEADNANPGEVDKIKAEQRQAKAGKYGSVKAAPFKPQAEEKPGEEKKLSWIVIELVGEDDKPIPGERYRITLPDASVCEGTLDQKGLARIDGFEAGTCKITFPDLDKEAWEAI